MSSPNPSTQKRIGRGVRDLDSDVWDREKQNAEVSGNYAKFTQNPAMKHHLLSAGNKRLAEARPKPALRTQRGALVSGRMIPEPKTQASGEKKIVNAR